MSDDWLLQYVALNIRMEFPRDVALTLACPLLWAVFGAKSTGLLTSRQADTPDPDGIRTCK